MTTLQAHVSAVVSGPFLTLPMMTITGGNITRDTAKSRDPGARFSRAIPAVAEIGNVTVGVDYDGATHDPIIPRLRAAATDETEYSIARLRRDGNGNVVSVTTYTGIIVGLTEPTGNTLGGADKSTLEIEFSCSGVTG